MPLQVIYLAPKSPRTSDVRELEHFAFHGIAGRGGIDRPAFSLNLGEEQRAARLHLARSGTLVPAVTVPGPLVINDTVRHHLASLQNLSLIPVRVDKLVDLDLDWAKSAEGATWWEGKARAQYDDPPEIIDPFRVLSAMPSTVKTSLYELVVARIERCKSKFGDVRPLRIDDLACKKKARPAVSTSLFEEHPIVFGGYWLIRREVFDQVQAHIDPRYYFIAEYMIRW